MNVNKIPNNNAEAFPAQLPLPLPLLFLLLLLLSAGTLSFIHIVHCNCCVCYDLHKSGIFAPQNEQYFAIVKDMPLFARLLILCLL